MRNELPAEQDATSGRAVLVRDVAVFQVKLLIDGFRDLLLVPASMIAGVIGLLSPHAQPGNGFYELLRIGRRSERWINLFGALEDEGPVDDDASSPADIDRMVMRVETYLLDEYRSGRLSGQAREKLVAAAEQLRRAAGRKP